jgi:hypothetical protein
MHHEMCIAQRYWVWRVEAAAQCTFAISAYCLTRSLGSARRWSLFWAPAPCMIVGQGYAILEIELFVP